MRFHLRIVSMAILVLILSVIPTSAATPGPAEELSFVPGRVLVKFRADVPSEVERDRIRAAGAIEVDRMQYDRVRVLQVPVGRERDVIQRLSESPDVEYAEVDALYRIQGAPSDVSYSQQWNMKLIGMEDAWGVTTGSASVLVAVVDQGVYVDHPEFKDRVVPGRNFAADSSAGTVDPNDIADYGTHGTHATGIIAAAGNNNTGSIGVAGMAWQTRILPVRVFPKSGGAKAEWLADGIRWAADQGARIINLSLGCEDQKNGAQCDNATVKAAVDYALSKGVFIAAAVCDSGSTGNWVCYPAAYSGVVGVGAVNKDGAWVSYSNYGAHVSVVAPGGQGPGQSTQVLSTYPTNRGSSYAWWYGTSQATPHVSGLAALMMAVSPTVTSDAVRSIMQSTAKDLGNAGKDDKYGYGLIDAAAAICTAGPFPDPAITAMTIGSGSENTAAAGRPYQAKLTVTNLGTVAWSGSMDAALTVSGATAGTGSGLSSLAPGASGTVTIDASAAPSATGAYSVTAKLTYGATQCRESNDSKSVTMTVISTPSFAVSPSSAQFAIDPAKWTSGPTSVAVGISGGIAGPFTVATSDSWLLVNGASTASGTTPATIVLTVDPSKVPAGSTASGTVTVSTSADVLNPTQVIQVSVIRFSNNASQSFLPGVLVQLQTSG